jgi:tRNA pseudouridine38-40 synthase
MRVKCVIAYDGSKFYGFQKQNSTKDTIATQIELALKSININSPIVGSGRTDRGVHATGQVIHFDIPNYWRDLEKLKSTLNQKLKYIEFKHITITDSDFHARFSAKKRIYRYIFSTTKKTVFNQDYISYYDKFDEDLLQKALSIFVGKHDFLHFHKTGSITHTTIREVYKSSYIKRGDFHYIYFEANGFLRSQVRMMVDGAMSVATKSISLEELKKQLDTKKVYRTKLAPAEGLYLARIIY